MTKKCVICGREFVPKRKNAICCCKECSKENDRRKRRAWRTEMHDRRMLEEQARKTSAISGIENAEIILAEMRRYNEKHGTKLTYGKYVSLRDNGWLK